MNECCIGETKKKSTKTSSEETILMPKSPQKSKVSRTSQIRDSMHSPVINGENIVKDKCLAQQALFAWPTTTAQY